MFSSMRLNYRYLSESDFDIYYQTFSDEQVMYYAYADPFMTEADAKKLFKEIIAHQDDPMKGSMYVATNKETNKVIGIVDYEVWMANNYGGHYEIGYFVLPLYWGKGYATEMGKALIEALFAQTNVHKISASCHGENTKSESVMQKLGMEKAYVAKRERFKHGKWADEIKYCLFREDYINK